MDKEFWNQRYGAHENVYGYEPNEFFKEQLDKQTPGSLLLPADGEGRNGVYAATKGWDVTAFDFSDVARDKALEFASKMNVQIEYTVADINNYQFPRQFDVIALIYIHLDPAARVRFHKRCLDALLPGGLLILEGFSKEQINNTTGGPKDLSMLHSLKDTLHDFAAAEILLSKRLTTQLNEGPFHSGRSDIIRLVIRKK
jgi:SAM-dependent methyltransferase